MRTKALIHAAKLALVFLLVGCSSAGDGSSGATAELGIGGGRWTGLGGVGGATSSAASHPGFAANPTGGGESGGAAGTGEPGSHETAVGGKSGGGACSFFGSIFKCPGSSSTPGTKTEGGSGGHRGATPAGSAGGAGTTVIPRLL
jgi:hypothetical protein